MTTFNRREFLAKSTASAMGLAGLTGTSHGESPKKRDENRMVQASNTFGIDFFQAVAAQPGNVFFSALSMEAAFGMLSIGARENTLTQMLKTLHLPENTDQTHVDFKKLFNEINDPKVPADQRGYELSLANALWGSQGFPWNKEFLTVTNKFYGAGLIDVDYSNPEEARARINKWVEEQTRDKIRDLMPKGSITTMTRMVLTNAIYFKGKWEKEFDKKVTKQAPFVHANGKTHPVAMMLRKAAVPYYEDDQWQAIQLPYKGQQTAMVVMLPKTRAGLAKLQNKITAKTVEEMTTKLSFAGEVQISLPKFKVETNYDLIPTLTTLGMVDVFSGRANLSGLHTTNEKLFVSAAIHKAYVDVNEEGTEAAAATGIGVGRASAPRPPKIFTADHPFLFAIRHLPTNANLFFGKVESL